MIDFHIAGGKIIDPTGKVFRKVGVNIYWLGNTPAQLCGDVACTKLLTDFPGINAVRIVCESGYTLAGLEPYVTRMTNLGIVVTICDFNIGPGKAPAAGATLAAQVAWYKLIAQTYANNPYVWPESQNEMYGDGATMAANHKALYDAVRSVAPTKIIALGFPGGGNPGTVGTSGQVNGSTMTPAVYAAMTGIVFDLHIYAWIVKRAVGTDSTDIPTIQNVIRGSVASATGIRAAKTLRSADGLVPVYIGEFGNSTTGSAPDANGVQLVEAVATMPVGDADETAGWLIFAAGTTNVGVPFFNALTDGNSNLTSPYGLQGQRLIKAASAGAIVAPPPPPAFTESVNNVTVPPASVIVGATGERWALTASGQVAVNGVADGTTRNVVSLAYVGRRVYQQNTAALWWSKSVSKDAWTGPIANPLPVVVPPGPSPEGAAVLAPSTAALNLLGSDWTIVNGQVLRDGVAPAVSAGIAAIEVSGGTIWAKNATGQWYRWPTSTGWTAEPVAVPAN